ncbi:MAG: NnrS family protein [Chromatiales bacterium 21-64-14]|nr:MAG: NnrS family protein [Chromatiales bacterium 21-64-14]HQU14762.1 NnrS family protein [Gammaproteobacteria bacterium]
MPNSTSRWAFSAAPHRMMMFAGATQMVVALLFWGAELVGRYTALWHAPPTVIPATYAHLFLMVYGLFPFFFLGFLMTTYPRWMDGATIPRRRYVRSFALLASGMLMVYVGLFASRALLAAGVGVYLAGWLTGIYALLRVYQATRAPDKFYETLINTALAAGALGMLAYLLWVISGNGAYLTFARYAGLWWFLVPVLLSVAHRMIPFFSNSVLKPYTVYQPRGALLLMLGCCVLHGVLAMAGQARWLWFVDLPLLRVAAYHTWRWGLIRSFQVRLLALLHVAFAWASVAFALYTIQSLTLFLSGRSILGLAPLHALGIGFLTSMIVAMVSRVTLGHSGRALAADSFTWACFWGVGITALLRIAAEIPAVSQIGGVSLNVFAAAAWLACLGPWVARYAPMYLRRRIDGKPG